MKNNKQEINEYYDEVSQKAFAVTSYPRAYKHTIYLDSALTHPRELMYVLDILDNSSEEDIIQIIINSPGGCASSLDSLLNSMSNCKAKIHGVASGTVASAATFVLMSCHTFQLSDNIQLLFHNANFGYSAESQDMKEYVLFQHQHNVKFIRKYYKDFFTEEEIEDIIVNKRQYWMEGEEFISRFERLNKVHSECVDIKTLKKMKKDDLIAFILGHC